MAKAKYPREKLTNKSGIGMKPGDKKHDEQVDGLQLYCAPDGRLRWRLRYRDNYGRFKHLTLSPGFFDAATARQQAIEHLFALSRGENPKEERLKRYKERTIKWLCEEYMRDVVMPSFKNKIMPRSMIKCHIGPKLGSLKINQLSFDEMLRFRTSMRNTPGVGNSCLKFLSGMMSYAERRGLRERFSNPCKGVKHFPANHRRRYATPDEMARISEVLASYRARWPRSVTFLLLLIMTGARKSEIGKALVTDLHGNRLELKDSKTGFRVIHLPDLMVEALHALPRDEGDLRLVGMSNPKDLWAKVRKEAECEDITIHDLRHSFASHSLAAGLPLEVIGELLGHRNVNSTKRYAHLITDKGGEAVNQTATVLQAMMKGAAERIVAEQKQEIIQEKETARPRKAPASLLYRQNPDIPRNFVTRFARHAAKRDAEQKAYERRQELVRKRKAKREARRILE